MLTFQTFSRKPDTLLHSDDDSTKLGQHIKNRIRKYTEVVFFLGPSSMRFGCQGLKNQFELAAAQNWNSRKSLPIFKASHFISATLLQFPSLKSRAKKVLKIEFQQFTYIFNCSMHPLAQNCERIPLVLSQKHGPFVFSSNKSCFKPTHGNSRNFQRKPWLRYFYDRCSQVR